MSHRESEEITDSSYRNPTADFLSSDEEKEEDEDSVTTADFVEEEQAESESSSYNERGLSDEDRSNLYRVLEAGGGPWNFHQNKAFKKAIKGQTATFGTDRSRRRKQFLSRISYVRGDRGYPVDSYVKELRALGIPASTNTLDKLQQEAISPSVPKPKSSKASSTPLRKTQASSSTQKSSVSRKSSSRVSSKRGNHTATTQASVQKPRVLFSNSNDNMDPLESEDVASMNNHPDVPDAFSYQTKWKHLPGFPTSLRGKPYFVVPVNLERSNDHLGLFEVDFIPEVTVTDSEGNTKKVELFKIILVTADMDEVVVEKLVKAYLVSPNQVLIQLPTVPSIWRSRSAEYEQALQINGTSTKGEHDIRRINMNSLELNSVRLFMLSFPSEIELETQYTQKRQPEPNQIQHNINPVMFTAGGCFGMTTEISYRVTVVPIQDRVITRAQVVQVDEMEEIRRRMERQARLYQQPGSGAFSPAPVPSANLGQQQQFVQQPYVPQPQQPYHQPQQQPFLHQPMQQQHAMPTHQQPAPMAQPMQHQQPAHVAQPMQQQPIQQQPFAFGGQQNQQQQPAPVSQQAAAVGQQTNALQQQEAQQDAAASVRPDPVASSFASRQQNVEETRALLERAKKRVQQQQAEEARIQQQQDDEAARLQQQAAAAQLQQQQANAQSTAGASDLQFLDAIEKEMQDDVNEYHQMQASLHAGSNNQQQPTVAAAAAPMSSLQLAAARLKEQQQPANIMVGQNQQEANENEQTEEGQGEKLFTLSESIMMDRIEDQKQAQIQQMQNRRREGVRKKSLQKRDAHMDRLRGFKAGSTKPQQSILPGQFSSPPLQQGPTGSDLPVLTQQSQNGTGNDTTAAGANMETGN